MHVGRAWGQRWAWQDVWSSMRRFISVNTICTVRRIRVTVPINRFNTSSTLLLLLETEPMREWQDRFIKCQVFNDESWTRTDRTDRLAFQHSRKWTCQHSYAWQRFRERSDMDTVNWDLIAACRQRYPWNVMSFQIFKNHPDADQFVDLACA